MKNPYDFIDVTGTCTFDRAYLDYNHSHRILDSEFNTTDIIDGSFRNILDVGDQQYKQSTVRKCEDKGHCQDMIIKKVSWTENSIVNSIYLESVDTHEIKSGNSPNEVIMINRFPIDENKLTTDNTGILIMDFSTDPPTTNSIIVGDFIKPEDFWGAQALKGDWLHANSAGRTVDGDYQIYAKTGSFLLFFDQNQQYKYTVATDPNIKSDFAFVNPRDKTQNSHDTHQMPNGHWLVLDNGTERPKSEGGPQSRCIEKTIDHATKTVQKVWEFKVEMHCVFTGSCRRLANGNTLILFNNCVTMEQDETQTGNESWEYQVQVYEVDFEGNVVCKADIPKGNFNIYRAQPSFSSTGNWENNQHVLNNNSDHDNSDYHNNGNINNDNYINDNNFNDINDSENNDSECNDSENNDSENNCDNIHNDKTNNHKYYNYFNKYDNDKNDENDLINNHVLYIMIFIIFIYAIIFLMHQIIRQQISTEQFEESLNNTINDHDLNQQVQLNLENDN